jgi:hypothetical protein
MADLWADFLDIALNDHRGEINSRLAAARKAIEDSIRADEAGKWREALAEIVDAANGVLSRIPSLRYERLHDSIEEARALLDQQGNDTLRLAELPDSQRNIDRETGKRLSYD